MVEQVIQIVGSLLVLAGFVGTQMRRLKTDSWPYLLLNVVGSGTLAVLALLGQQWGFLLLEGVWAVVSAIGIVQKARRGAAPVE